jgi:hypothetical protein
MARLVLSGYLAQGYGAGSISDGGGAFFGAVPDPRGAARLEAR